MKVVYSLLIPFLFATIHSVYAEEETIEKPSGVTRPGAVEMTEEEINRSLGRFGEREKIPEDFQFSEAENLMWRSNHLENIKEPSSLFYEFEQTGSVAEGFSDSVFLKIIDLNEDGSKNALLEFFTAARAQRVDPANVTEIYGNPVVGIYMGGDVQLMQQITEGNWRHFHKLIKISLRKTAVVEPISFSFNGKDYKGKKIYFQPYVEDIHRRKYENYAEKSYELIFSDEIPGKLYQIKTVIEDRSKENAEPLIQEVLTLVDIKSDKS